MLVTGQAGHQAIGLKFDRRTDLLCMAGGPTGSAFVYDASDGTEIASIELTGEPTTFINDVVVTRRAVFFTDSFRPVLYSVWLQRDGSLPRQPESEELPLSGDFEYAPGELNAKGIAATPNGRSLIVVNTTLASLYRVDPATGLATLIDLDSGSVPAGDGILLHGRTLHVVQNFLNQISVVRLDARFSSGDVVATISSPLFRIPTTVARFGNVLDVVNARFDTPPTPDTVYEVVRVKRP